MTITSQALRGKAKSDYNQILKKFKRLSAAKQKELSAVQAKITADSIKSEPQARDAIKKKMADLIKLRILNDPKFNP
jgi:hypothetical protein